MVILRAGKNPVVAHLFLNHMLDYDVALGNFQAIGYQTPQNQLDPASLVADGIIPANLQSVVLLPDYFTEGFQTLELPPAIDAMWHATWEQFKAGG